MISMLAACSVILLEFLKLMWVSLNPQLSWGVPPLALLFLVCLAAGAFREMLHRRLS
jgi:cytochrome c oxidase subunit IV